MPETAVKAEAIKSEPLSGLESGSAADFIALMKPRVMSLVIFTALIGMILAPGDMHPVLAISALVLIATGAGASAALNMWYDADIDAEMTRTKSRPVPAGRVDGEDALQFGLWVGGASVMSLAVLINYLSAALLGFTIFFYAVVYTMWLKRSTAQNIVIGGAAGALPPVIGWAAAANTVTLEPILLFAIIFFWTPPHFWALALIKNDDYARVGVPMLPVTAGDRATRTQILAYALILAATSFAPYYFGFAGAFYMAGVGVLNAVFVGLSAWLYVASDAQRNRLAGFLFAYSIFYLFILFALLPADRLMGA